MKLPAMPRLLLSAAISWPTLGVAAEPDPALLSLLIEQGSEVYAKFCASCHQPSGEGIGVFPAISGSAIATGDPAKHIDVVFNGVPGTAMRKYADKLNSAEIAAVITYQRNALGNSTGDYVLPETIEAMRY